MKPKLAAPIFLAILGLLWGGPALALNMPPWGLDLQSGLTRNEDGDDNSIYGKVSFLTPNLELSLTGRQEDYKSIIYRPCRCPEIIPEEGTRLRFEATYAVWRTHGPTVAWEHEPNGDDRWEVGWRLWVGPMYD